MLIPRALVALVPPMAVMLAMTPASLADSSGGEQACIHVVTGETSRGAGPYHSLNPPAAGVSTGSQMYGVEVSPASCLTTGNPVAVNNYHSYDEWPTALLP